MKFLENPKMVEYDDAIEQLKDSVFSIVFQDGTAKNGVASTANGVRVQLDRPKA